MRILQLHSDFIEYKPLKKEAVIAEQAEKKTTRLEDVVVLFTSAEESDNDTVAKQAVDEVKNAIQKLGINKILIYPYAHLSNNLAKPSKALRILKAMEKYAKEEGIVTYRTPFGWNKQFALSVKGHPLAEQLRVISSNEEKKREEKVSKALKTEQNLKSKWFIMGTGGEMTPVEKFNFEGHKMLEKFANYEMAKIRAVQRVPPHVILMKKLGLTDYEFASDPGNFRWPPKGRLVKALLERFVTQKVTEYGGMEVETPIMYDFNHPSLADYLERFPARQYVVKSEDRDLFLRFAACFGQFLMARDAQISYRQMPFRIYELTRYSFRREKSGELVGLKRLRTFTMPDCHAMCTDLDQAKKEFMTRFELCLDTMNEGLEFSNEEYELGIRFTKDFYEKNKGFIISLVKRFKRPALIEILPQRAFYWVLKWEFNFVDNLDKASALSTDQIDVENAERYKINYVDEKGEKKSPLILHCSPSGSIERCIYALLERAHKEQLKGRIPALPLWITPTQVRVIPISDKFLSQAEKTSDEIEKKFIRADVDDRPLTLQKKVREAEVEWINYILVIGQREIDSGVFPVRDRKGGKIREMQLQELISEIQNKTEGKPFQHLTMPRNLSKRPQF